MAIFDEKIEIRERCKGCRSRSGFLPNVAFAGFCLFSLPFFALPFVKFVCRRLFAKFFDLRSWLSVSLPLRSVGTPSPLPREPCFLKPRNNLEPCTDSLELCRRVWHWGESIISIVNWRTTKKAPEDISDFDVLRDWDWACRHRRKSEQRKFG